MTHGPEDCEDCGTLHMPASVQYAPHIDPLEGIDEFPNSVVTYNDGCERCGHWKLWNVAVGSDGNVWVECYKCGHRWVADKARLISELHAAAWRLEDT